MRNMDKSVKEKIIGVIGGMGPAATSDLLSRIVKLPRQSRGLPFLIRLIQVSVAQCLLSIDVPHNPLLPSHSSLLLTHNNL